MELAETNAAPRSPWRSIGAVLLGILAIFILSLGTDQVFHSLNVYPGWDQPMNDPSLLSLALAYRIVYGIVGSYLTARFAPRAPMFHALMLGIIGTVLSTAGAIGAIVAEMSAIWYPIALVLTALPCAWLGGVLLRLCHAK